MSPETPILEVEEDKSVGHHSSDAVFEPAEKKIEGEIPRGDNSTENARRAKRIRPEDDGSEGSEDGNGSNGHRRRKRRVTDDHVSGGSASTKMGLREKTATARSRSSRPSEPEVSQRDSQTSPEEDVPPASNIHHEYGAG